MHVYFLILFKTKFVFLVSNSQDFAPKYMMDKTFGKSGSVYDSMFAKVLIINLQCKIDCLIIIKCTGTL